LPPEWAGVLLVGHLRKADVVQRAYGESGGAPLTADRRLNIASLGKMFTAVAIGQLVDAGRVRFEDPIGQHLPALPAEFSTLTVAQLLTHTAGLGSYLEEHALERVEALPTARSLLPLLTAQAPREIGQWRYSNTSFALAAAIVETVSGLDYERYVRERIFAPAGMTGVAFAPAQGDALPTIVTSDGKVQHPAVGRMRGGPAGGAFATAADLHRFARALIDGTLLRPATTERMTSLQHEFTPRRADGIARGWGYGFGVNGQGADRSFGHTGGIPGGSAALRVRAADGRVTVMLSPQDRVDPPPAASLMAVDPAACEVR
jgi:CubicO group peptidase (beta-lactamase class C family)